MRITKEQIKQMNKLKEKGLSMKEIAKKMKLVYSTVQYHLSSKQKENAKKRAREYSKNNWKNRDKNKAKKYQKYYQSKKYNEDEEFREKVKKRNRDYQRERYNKIKHSYLNQNGFSDTHSKHSQS